ncbi:hypothetical protein LCGC14_1860160, partial [marine sediment metagenome]
KIPGGDKAKADLARLVSPEFESARARIPEDGPFWLGEWLHEHKLHPLGQNDDYVETTIIIMRYFEEGTPVGVDRVPMSQRKTGVPVSSPGSGF